MVDLRMVHDLQVVKRLSIQKCSTIFFRAPFKRKLISLIARLHSTDPNRFEYRLVHHWDCLRVSQSVISDAPCVSYRGAEPRGTYLTLQPSALQLDPPAMAHVYDYHARQLRHSLTHRILRSNVRAMTGCCQELPLRESALFHDFMRIWNFLKLCQWFQNVESAHYDKLFVS